MPTAHHSIEEGWDGSILWWGLSHSTKNSLCGHLSSLALLVPGFSQAISLALKCDLQEGCGEKKLSLRTWQGKKAWKWRLLRARCDGPYSNCLIPTLSATQGWAQSIFRASAFP